MQKKENHQFTIEEALNLIISDKRIKKGLAESMIKENWAKIMGNIIAKHTTAIYLNGEKLLVYFNSPVVKNEVNYNKEKAVQLINEELGYEAVKELVIK